MKMPTKDPGLWAVMLGWLMNHWTEIACFLLTTAIACLRIYQEGGRGMQLFIKSLLCGLMWWPVDATLNWIGIPSNLTGPMACSLGLIGVESIREFGMRYINNKAGG